MEIGGDIIRDDRTGKERRGLDGKGKDRKFCEDEVGRWNEGARERGRGKS